MKKRWYRTITHHPVMRRMKRRAKYLLGLEPTLRPDASVITNRVGDWQFVPEAINKGSVIYSLGVGRNIHLDLALIKRFGATVHAFDPTPLSCDWLRQQKDMPELLYFHPWAICGENCRLRLYPRVRRGRRTDGTLTIIRGTETAGAGIEVPGYTIGTVKRKLNHSSIDLLKVDIEGAEYAALGTMLAEQIYPRQLLVEFHHRFPAFTPAMTTACIKHLRAHDYDLVAVSDTGRECTFLHTVNKAKMACTTSV